VIDVRQWWQTLPSGRKAWWLALVVLCLIAGAAAFHRNDGTMAAVSYILS